MPKKTGLRLEVERLRKSIDLLRGDFLANRDALATCVNGQSGKVDKLERAVVKMIAASTPKKRKKRA